jgi:hypothetical protein
MSPELPLALKPEVTDTAAPIPPPRLSPPSILTVPAISSGEVFVERPAETTSFPPEPMSFTPTISDTDPLWEASPVPKYTPPPSEPDAPARIVTVPDLPVMASPVLKTRYPELSPEPVMTSMAPEPTEFPKELDMSTLPLPVSLEVPDWTSTNPPEPLVNERPALNTMLAPCPESPLPARTRREPPRPEKLRPVLSTRNPELA